VSTAAGTLTRGEAFALTLLVALALTWSAIGPYDWATWWMEVLPVLVAAPILFATARRFPLTPLAYRLICAHALVLIVGAHTTYARVPVGDWVRELLALERNPYDRFGHFAQGFVPAILARELLMRCTPLRRGGWLAFLVACCCLAISALYELAEWGAAMALGASAHEFLGTQGDVWDTQWDMFLALLGALAALALLPRVHDRQLARLEQAPRG
jgi:putative membrane protein